MGEIFTLMLNILIVALLAVTIAYCWLLNRRIKILQDSRSELASLLKHFDESTQRASESIIALQTASKKIGENIQFRVDKANYLLDDLAFMIEKGNKLASQMEAGFAVGRARSKVISEEMPEMSAEEVEAEFHNDKGFTKAPVAKAVEKPISSRDKTSASLEAVLGRVVGRNNGAAEHEAPAQRETSGRGQPTRSRSKAEQELLDMIKAGIKG